MGNTTSTEGSLPSAPTATPTITTPTTNTTHTTDTASTTNTTHTTDTASTTNTTPANTTNTAPASTTNSTPTKIAHKVLCLGSIGVGKSTLILRFVKGIFVEDYDPTVEDYFRKEIQIDDKKYWLDILDAALEEEWRPSREQHIETCDTFIIFFCPNYRSSFQEIHNLINQIKRTKDRTGPVPIVLCATKSDLYADERQVTNAEVNALLKQYNIPDYAYIETSAKAEINVDAPFKAIVKLAKSKSPKKEMIKKKK